ncbi:phage tail tape measure protein [Paenibacillus piri]|uniref:Phage tail tape measure protein domain-containing protein n=1 Tax=Paenibacillus piri TaxID=2547395 RepID=A0A4V2ZS75_9BACL|nr:phage tail tape measure protein [Paenibacillus piri]TDF92164.1 hypothetical protein E1757_30690 [Paenibacillus piri]
MANITNNVTALTNNIATTNSLTNNITNSIAQTNNLTKNITNNINQNLTNITNNLTEVFDMSNTYIKNNFNTINQQVIQFVKVTEAAAKDAADSTNQTTTKFMELGKKLSGVTSAVISGVSSSLIAVGKASWGAAEQAQKSMNIIRSGTGATGAQLEGLMSTYANVGASVPDSLDSVATVIADVHQKTGATGPSLEDMAKKIMDLGSLTGVSSSTMSSSLMGAMQSWSISADQGGQMFDKMFYLSQQTGIGVNSLADKLTKFGGPMRELGFDFDTSAALVGQWTKQGLDADMVLGSFTNALGNMSKVGVKDTNQALTIAINKIKQAGSTADATKLGIEAFGEASGPAMAAAIREGRLELGSLLQEMSSNSAGIIDQTSAATETISDKYGTLKNNISMALAPLGQQLMSIVEKAFPGIEKIVNLLKEGLSSAMPYITSFASVLGDVLLSTLNAVADGIAFFMVHIDVLGPALIGLAVGIFAGLVPSLWAMAVAGWAAITPLLPFIAIGLALAAVIAGIILVVKNWGNIMNWLSSLWKGFLDILPDSVKKFFGIQSTSNSSTGAASQPQQAVTQSATNSPAATITHSSSRGSFLVPNASAGSTQPITNSPAVTAAPASSLSSALPPNAAAFGSAGPAQSSNILGGNIAMPAATAPTPVPNYTAPPLSAPKSSAPQAPPVATPAANAAGSNASFNPVINITMNGDSPTAAQDIADRVKLAIQDVFESASRRQGIARV